MPRYPRPDPAPVGHIVMPSPPPSALPSPRHRVTPQHLLLATQTSAVATTTSLARLSVFAYPDDAPICSSPNGYWVRCPRALAPRSAVPDQAHTTPRPWLHKRPRPHGHQTTYMHLLSMSVGLHISTWPPLPFAFTPNIAPALASECVRWREEREWACGA
jgi:hypothetical protein